MNVFKNHPSFLALLLIVAAVIGLDYLTRQKQGSSKMKLSPEIRSKALSVLREGLLTKDPEQFWFAMHAAEGLTLGGYGDEVLTVVGPMLATETDGQRLCGIARELIRAGDREKVTVLVEVLSREDPYGHIHAAESLYKVVEVGDEAVMRRRFEDDGPIKLRLMAAGALARKNDDAKAFAYIRECLRGAEPEGIQIAAWLLGVIGDKSDIEPLRTRLPDAPEPIIRAYIEHAMASLGDAEGLRLLEKNLEDEDPVIRTYAATFAGDAKAYATQGKLERIMLDDSFLDARIRAAQTLLQLSR